MAEHQVHVDMDRHKGPIDVTGMRVSQGLCGNLQLGGLFPVVQVPDTSQPGTAAIPAGPRRRRALWLRVSASPDFGAPIRRRPFA